MQYKMIIINFFQTFEPDYKDSTTSYDSTCQSWQQRARLANVQTTSLCLVSHAEFAQWIVHTPQYTAVHGSENRSQQVVHTEHRIASQPGNHSVLLLWDVFIPLLRLSHTRTPRQWTARHWGHAVWAEQTERRINKPSCERNIHCLVHFL